MEIYGPKKFITKLLNEKYFESHDSFAQMGKLMIKSRICEPMIRCEDYITVLTKIVYSNYFLKWFNCFILILY